MYDCTVYWAYIYIIRVLCPRAGPSLQAQEPRLQFCWRQVFHRKLRNHGYNFTRDWICAVASRCFPHPTLPLAFKQTLKDLNRSQGTTWRWGEWIWLTVPSYRKGLSRPRSKFLTHPQKNLFLYYNAFRETYIMGVSLWDHSTAW